MGGLLLQLLQGALVGAFRRGEDGKGIHMERRASMKLYFYCFGCERGFFDDERASHCPRCDRPVGVPV